MSNHNGSREGRGKEDPHPEWLADKPLSDTTPEERGCQQTGDEPNGRAKHEGLEAHARKPE